MPLILVSPAYQGGHTLVVVTFDGGNPITDTTLCCNEQPGPAQAPFGHDVFNTRPPTKED